ncbi:Thymidylate synthase [Trichinella pseudospiralis]
MGGCKRTLTDSDWRLFKPDHRSRKNVKMKVWYVCRATLAPALLGRLWQFAGVSPGTTPQGHLRNCYHQALLDAIIRLLFLNQLQQTTLVPIGKSAN